MIKYDQNSVDDKLFLSLTKSSRRFGKYIGVIDTGFVLFLNILYASVLNATFSLLSYPILLLLQYN